MYLLNAETEISWVIGRTDSVITYDDLDLVTTDPNGNIVYLDSPIAEIDFVAPTPTTEGSASYLFTPTMEGLWKVQLATGISTNYSILSKVEMFVLDNTTVVNPIKHTPEGNNGSIEIAKDAVLLTSEATKLVFQGSNFNLSEVAGVVSISLGDYPDVIYQSQGDLISALANSLGESALIASLRDRLDLIDQAGPGSVNERVLAVSERTDSLEASIEDPSTGLLALSSVNNSQATWITEVNGEMLAQAEDITTYFAQVGESYSAVQTHTSVISGLSAKYTVKVDVGGNVAGFGLASEVNEAGEATSEFAIVADKFSIAAVATDPNAAESETAPFFHLTEATVVDGVTVPPGTYMKAAFIADATIQNAHIGNVIQSNDGGATWSINKEGNITATSITLAASTSNWSGITDDDGNKPANNADVTNYGDSRIDNDEVTLAWLGTDAYTTDQDLQTLHSLVNDSPSGTGFFSDATHLGYYNGSAFTTYMDSSGNFYLNGTGGGLAWVADSNSLIIQGEILTMGDTPGSTERVEINKDNDNHVTWYGNLGGGVVQVAKIGVETDTDDYIMTLGSNSSSNSAICLRARSYSKSAIILQCNGSGTALNVTSTGTGTRAIYAHDSTSGTTGRSAIYAGSTNNPGLLAASTYDYAIDGASIGEAGVNGESDGTNKAGVRGVATAGYGVYGLGKYGGVFDNLTLKSGSQIHLVYDNTTDNPTHSETKGCMYMNNNSTTPLWVCMGGTTWRGVSLFTP